MEGLAGLYVVFMFVALVVAVLWIVLPFAIFGTKPLLKELIQETKWGNEMLKQILDRLPPPPPR